MRKYGETDLYVSIHIQCYHNSINVHFPVLIDLIEIHATQACSYTAQHYGGVCLPL